MGNNNYTMEKILKTLFDYQRFEKNESLEKLIRETGSRYSAELADDALSLVNAAGEPETSLHEGSKTDTTFSEQKTKIRN